MSKLNERTIANMDSVLEEVCRVFPNGGDHERRKHIAQKLKQHAMQGDTSLTALRAVALSALKEIKQRTAQSPFFFSIAMRTGESGVIARKRPIVIFDY